MKVLVDTDAGSDIDDALCLAYLLSREDVEIVGITTVSGMPETRARLVSTVTTFYGVEVPICPGAATPLSGDQRQPEVPQSEILPRWDHQMTTCTRPAVELMREAIEAHPGEIVLLAIGPLTNVARLALQYPSALASLSRLVCMSGRFSNYQNMAAVPEWNVLCDIQASRIVYAAAEQVDTLLVSSDVTRRLVIHKPEATDRLGGIRRQIGPVFDMSEIWFSRRSKMTIHDGLAASLIFHPDLCTYKRGRPILDLQTGATSWEDDSSSRIAATSDVDGRRFFDHFFGALA